MLKHLLFTASCLIASAGLSQNKYVMDKTQSQLTFTSTHIGITKVDGKINDFMATFKSAKEDYTDAEITLTAEVASLHTDEEKRDVELRGPKWMDAGKFPTIEFKSNSFKKINDK